MPADGTTHLREASAFRTLFTTEHSFDAKSAGFDGATEVGTDGGFAAHFDGRGSLPSLVINGSDGEVVITGFRAIRAFVEAVQRAEEMAFRMEPAR